MAQTHRYETSLRWSGSTGLGWDAYTREHAATARGVEQEVRITTGEAKGDPSVLNPELLLLMAASSCQMLWFLDVASRARVDVVEYRDEAVALMPLDEEPVRITEIELRPTIAVSGEVSEERIRKLVDTAHRHCFIANSLTAQMTITPTLEVRT
jgi:organic hydroperoxide reductase OsmC/OhrA